MCGAGWAMCSCEAVCGHGVGVARRNACRCGRYRDTRAVAAVVPPRPPRNERGTHCVCVRHTARRTLWGVQLVRQGWELGGREGSPHALRGRRSLPAAHRHLCACDRRAGGGRAPWSQRDARRSATASLRTGGVTSGRKTSNWSSKAKPTKAAPSTAAAATRARSRRGLAPSSRRWLDAGSTPA